MPRPVCCVFILEDVKLAPVKTVEPMSVTDLAKTELSRNATLERVNSFDKTSLKNTLTEEKVVLPDANAISMVRTLQTTPPQLDYFELQLTHGTMQGSRGSVSISNPH